MLRKRCASAVQSATAGSRAPAQTQHECICEEQNADFVADHINTIFWAAIRVCSLPTQRVMGVRLEHKQFYDMERLAAARTASPARCLGSGTLGRTSKPYFGSTSCRCNPDTPRCGRLQFIRRRAHHVHLQDSTSAGAWNPLDASSAVRFL